MAPAQRLAIILQTLGVPLLHLSGSATELHLVFDPQRVTDVHRKLTFEVLARFNWSWRAADGRRGN
jgi:hypothetical protein